VCTGAYLDKKQPGGGKVIVSSNWQSQFRSQLPPDMGWKIVDPGPVHPAYCDAPTLSLPIFTTSPDALADIDWLQLLELEVFEQSRPFRLLPYAFAGSGQSMGFRPQANGFVSIATHCAIDKVHHIASMAESSDVFISVSVLIKENIGVSHALIRRMRECSPAISQLVDFHLVLSDGLDEYADYSTLDPHRPSFLALANKSAHAFDTFPCDLILKEGRNLLFKSETYHDAMNSGLWYPVNMLRNVAARFVRTEHVIHFELDIVPCASLGAIYESAAKSLLKEQPDSKVAIVIPGWCRSYCAISRLFLLSVMTISHRDD
jgi:hypothetical protein